MARVKIISDAQVLDQVLSLVAEGQDASFGAVGRITRLAPSTLAQRFGTVAAMRGAAVARGWVEALARLTLLEAAMPPNGKNLVAFLKALAEQTEGPLLARLLAEGSEGATQWRQSVEGAIAARLVGVPPGQAAETAAVIFAAWVGRQMWAGTTGAEFRLRNLVRRLPGGN